MANQLGREGDGEADTAQLAGARAWHSLWCGHREQPVWHNMAWHGTAQHSMTWHSMARWSTALPPPLRAPSGRVPTLSGSGSSHGTAETSCAVRGFCPVGSAPWHIASITLDLKEMEKLRVYLGSTHVDKATALFASAANAAPGILLDSRSVPLVPAPPLLLTVLVQPTAAARTCCHRAAPTCRTGKWPSAVQVLLPAQSV